MQAAVEAARAAQEQQAASAADVGGPAAPPQAASAPPSERSAPSTTTLSTTTPSATTPSATTPSATAPPDAIPSADPAGLPVWAGQAGSVRQPSPSGSAFLPVTVPAPPKQPERGTRRRVPTGPRVAGAAALAVILVTAGAVALTLSARDGGSKTPASGQPRPTQQARPSLAVRTANLAARWVAQQVSHEAVVACDKAMCAALAAHGFPGRHLKLIGPGAPYPRRAEIVVETPLIERQFGEGRNVALAPAVLTRIGTGSTAIAIRAVARPGPASYRTQIKADLQQRRVAGAGLLTSGQVRVSALARRQLAAGKVDARLIVVLTAIASVHPIHILGFGTAFTGTSPAVPLRTAYLAQNDPVAGLGRAGYITFLLTQLAAEPGVYRPQIAGPAHRGPGRPVFQITFPAPSPLRLLGG